MAPEPRKSRLGCLGWFTILFFGLIAFLGAMQWIENRWDDHQAGVAARATAKASASNEALAEPLRATISAHGLKPTPKGDFYYGGFIADVGNTDYPEDCYPGGDCMTVSIMSVRDCGYLDGTVTIGRSGMGHPETVPVQWEDVKAGDVKTFQRATYDQVFVPELTCTPKPAPPE
ncbi:hypothetical protein IC607_11140 [Cellulomonas sp. JH27-2]|uniref:hypothetical protein n=1 Tax=Cellulomonas sp. JH27-2 TaxID=2774139 RepID=UPI0017812B41|nr:hypothetical protein [Cellulomonas sp. JH27-2]MBD8059520.1 hypothetical protein [Cellulomonas sp. JH27-2]